MEVFIEGLVGIIFFYIVVLCVGIWAGIKFKGDSEVETMNAGKRIGWFVGTLTLVGTWCGGGYINGAAEQMYKNGLVNVQVPIGYSLALFVGALLFIRSMREGNYVTMLDPFQIKYGYKYGALMILPAIASELFWCAAVLNSLGNAIEVVLGIGTTISIVVSAVFAGLYTLVGGLSSITYTDVLQLFFIAIGLILSAPFAFTNPNIDFSLSQKYGWSGTIQTENIATYIDNLLLLIFGGIPWQGYFQRIFSIKSTELAIRMSWFSMLGTLLMGIPALLIGYAARITHWDKTDYGSDIDPSDSAMVLPLTLRYLVPPAVSFFGLGAVTGAVMSSADSAILASSAMFTRNIYKNLFRPKATDFELHVILRVCIVIVTIMVTLISLELKSIYYLSFLCSDLVYVILFPQLFVTLYFPKTANTYGSTVSYLFGVVLRLLSGEEGLKLPTVIKYPGFDEEKNAQRFPFRTFIMTLSLLVFISVNYITQYMFVKRNVNRKYDIFKCFPLTSEAAPPPQEASRPSQTRQQR